ncbi:hypothetical protein B0H15DRAFT_779410 [Mycena belliarum]|uniref:Uncharacterized protein n=1 Tax=Mycena belliarum TaxID=1033014 RepID=A0AAD6U4J2_9AGAR|nr:hypothetical protein B0H15DRAFT_779410 [Mycena belliae]
MRRKSSAQNLLSLSFKNPPGNVPQTPTVSTPIPKEFDTQSLYSDTTTLNNPAVPQGASVDYLRDIIQKRIITLTYIRNIHEGRSHWFHTIMISRTELDRVFNNTEMKKRTFRFAILGMSLSSLLDISQPQDLLKGLINTLQEYEQSREDSEKPKIRTTKRLFRTKTGKRPGMLTDYIGSYGDGSEGYLVTPHIPFPLDYHQTLLSLLDVLSEVYNKISKLLGPSPFSHSAQNMMGPLGLLAPHPGVSYLFSPEVGPYGTPQQGQGQFSSNPHFSSNSSLPVPDLDAGSLWGIANVSTGGNMSSPPAAWTAGLGEMVLKIDGKLKKITTVLLKELDQFARNGIKDELASLDPLLRNINVPEEGSRTIYDFEGM